jgi:hypothetical protein
MKTISRSDLIFPVYLRLFFGLLAALSATGRLQLL